MLWRWGWRCDVDLGDLWPKTWVCYIWGKMEGEREIRHDGVIIFNEAGRGAIYCHHHLHGPILHCDDTQY